MRKTLSFYLKNVAITYINNLNRAYKYQFVNIFGIKVYICNQNKIL